MNILKDFNKMVEMAEEGKKINKKSLSLYETRELQTIQQELKTKGESSTILESIHILCMYCGLKTRSQGIGWKIYKQPSVL
jgi:hypothetical protein